MLDAYRGQTVLVTGASGYLAGAATEALGRAGAKVVPVPRAALRDAAAWARLLPGARFVLHLAAQTSVYAAAQDPAADFAANVEPMQRLLEACARVKEPPFIVFAGSATECGLPARVPCDETLPDEPVTVYDLHKLLAEKALEGHCRMGLARGTTLRFCNVYGPGPSSSSSDRGVVNMMVQRGLRGEPITVYGRGEQLRDYVFVDDAAAALLAAGAAAEKTCSRHFVLGSGQGRTIAAAFQTAAERVGRACGRAPEVRSVPEPAGLSIIESRRFVADPSAFRAASGWEPRVGFEEGLDRTVAFFRSRLTEAR